jgi:hypothetical protein
VHSLSPSSLKAHCWIAGAINDLHRFDPVELQWTEINSSSMLEPPSPRMAAGFAAADDRLFVFAGAFPATRLRPGPPGQASQLSIVNYTCKLTKILFYLTMIVSLV